MKEVTTQTQHPDEPGNGYWAYRFLKQPFVVMRNKKSLRSNNQANRETDAECAVHVSNLLRDTMMQQTSDLTSGAGNGY